MPNDKENPFSTLKPTDLGDRTLFKLNNLLNFLADQIAKLQGAQIAVQKVVTQVQTNIASGQLIASGGGGGGGGTGGGGGGGGTGGGGTTGPPTPVFKPGQWTSESQINYPVLAYAQGMSQDNPSGAWYLQGRVLASGVAGDAGISISQEAYMTFKGLGLTVNAQVFYGGTVHPTPSAEFLAQWPVEAQGLTAIGIYAGYVPSGLLTPEFIQSITNPTPVGGGGGSSGSLTVAYSVVPVITTVQYLDWASAPQSIDVVTDITVATHLLNWNNGLIQ